MYIHVYIYIYTRINPLFLLLKSPCWDQSLTMPLPYKPACSSVTLFVGGVYKYTVYHISYYSHIYSYHRRCLKTPWLVNWNAHDWQQPQAYSPQYSKLQLYSICVRVWTFKPPQPGKGHRSITLLGSSHPQNGPMSRVFHQNTLGGFAILSFRMSQRN